VILEVTHTYQSDVKHRRLRDKPQWSESCWALYCLSAATTIALSIFSTDTSWSAFASTQMQRNHAQLYKRRRQELQTEENQLIIYPTARVYSPKAGSWLVNSALSRPKLSR